jgi:iron complex transport system ATP-binding protein
MRPFQPLSPTDRIAVDEALELTGLTDLAPRRLDRLSGGQRQRAWIALSVAQHTPILVLDEPTTYLDLPFQIEVLRLVRKLCDESGKTIIMVLHDINLASHYADKIVALKHGQVAFEGSPEIVITETNLACLFDMSLRIGRSADQSRPFVLPE